YGRLERILVCVLPKDKILGPISGKKRLLAVTTPCKNTHGRDASLEITTYRGMGTSIVTDLQSVVAVVGRAESRGVWTITDRTGGLIHPEFVPAEEGVEFQDE
ncbi:hypothetical protein DFH09DRAFT_911658, partial [Mycena vulgaris]